MPSLLGYFLCLVALVPALSPDVFFGLIGKTTRQYEVLTIYRAILQMLTTVTSPVKIALATAVLLFGYAVESRSGRRVINLAVVTAAGFSSTLQLLTVSRSAGLGVAAVMIGSSAASLFGVSWGTRGLETTAAC